MDRRWLLGTAAVAAVVSTAGVIDMVRRRRRGAAARLRGLRAAPTPVGAFLPAIDADRLTASQAAGFGRKLARAVPERHIDDVDLGVELEHNPVLRQHADAFIRAYWDERLETEAPGLWELVNDPAAVRQRLAPEIRRHGLGAVPPAVPAPAAITADGVPAALRKAQYTLEGMGWSMQNFEVNAVAATARIELRRFDGRCVTFDVRNGKATLTREQVETVSVAVGRRGDRAVVDRLRTRFLGRNTVGTGLRSGLRSLAQYLDDNSLTEHRLGRDAAVALLNAGRVDGVDTVP